MQHFYMLHLSWNVSRKLSVFFHIMLKQSQHLLCDDVPYFPVWHCKSVSFCINSAFMCEISRHEKCTPEVIHGCIQFVISQILTYIFFYDFTIYKSL